MTPDQIAEWMLEELQRDGFLDQETAVGDIALKFGDEFTYENENGNSAIRPDVLAAFRKLSANAVVWDRSERQWRKRQTDDDPGRQQG